MHHILKKPIFVLDDAQHFDRLRLKLHAFKTEYFTKPSELVVRSSLQQPIMVVIGYQHAAKNELIDSGFLEGVLRIDVPLVLLLDDDHTLPLASAASAKSIIYLARADLETLPEYITLEMKRQASE